MQIVKIYTYRLNFQVWPATTWTRWQYNTWRTGRASTPAQFVENSWTGDIQQSFISSQSISPRIMVISVICVTKHLILIVQLRITNSLITNIRYLVKLVNYWRLSIKSLKIIILIFILRFLTTMSFYSRLDIFAISKYIKLVNLHGSLERFF